MDFKKLQKAAVKHCMLFSKVRLLDSEEAVQETTLEFIEQKIEFSEDKEFKRTFFRRVREIAWNNKRRGTLCRSKTTTVKEFFVLYGEKADIASSRVASDLKSPERNAIEKNFIEKFNEMVGEISKTNKIFADSVDTALLYLQGYTTKEISEKENITQELVSLRFKNFVYQITKKAHEKKYDRVS